MSEDILPTRAEQVQAFLGRTPFAQEIGMRCEVMGDEMTAIMPFQQKLIGNFTIQALHGGAIAAFLELTAMAQVYLVTEHLERPPRPINLTIDYLRQGHAKDTYARATITKMGRRMCSVRAEAWQDQRSKPVTSLLAHFKVGGD
ncbi:PaaI family thioesterase [Hyphomonas jannaschiana]|uniref:Thioesterase family protein n=1 Tax=Hyphomonas jannaschiana VP2 TaxID=1280952 RepID=A0A059FEY0_9PROT|nr:PaaI family thioesterase [Hyphomonas jannaschiana]KCZ89038.1 thioesterase family protein [Hyphomonas jannaschiana VP2]MCA8893169.1 PaaI family thioesterase [Hyphomonas sp.]